MQFDSVIFFIFLFGCVLLYSLVNNSLYRYLVVALANLIFIYSFVSDWMDCWALVSFLILGYAMIVTVPVCKHEWITCCYLTLLIGYFALLKQYYIPESWSNGIPSFTTLGLSYILFRTLQVIIDRSQGMLDVRPNFLKFFSFVVFFPAFLAGPIHNFEKFDSNIKTYMGSVDFFSERMLIGLIKILIFAPAFQQAFLSISNGLHPGQVQNGLIDDHFREAIPFAVQMGLSAVSYVFYLYFNFSGYTDIAISVALILGIAIPENFNKPFLATNVSEFWARWHMSLSEWIKTYMFNPMLSSSLKLFPGRFASNAVSYLVLFFVFFVIGIWHGSTLSFFYFGLYLGISAVIHKSYQQALNQSLGRKSIKTLYANPIYVYFCRGLTFSYFALGLMCFVMDASQIKEMLGKIGLIAGITTFLSISVLMSIAMAGYSFLCRLSANPRKILLGYIPGGWYSQARIVFLTLFILLFGTLFGVPSAFVYQTF